MQAYLVGAAAMFVITATANRMLRDPVSMPTTAIAVCTVFWPLASVFLAWAVFKKIVRS
jgi:hypothetical protein